MAVIFLETQSNWSTAYARRVARFGEAARSHRLHPRVHQARSMPELAELLEALPNSFLVLEWRPEISQEIAPLVAGLNNRFPEAAAAIVVDRKFQELAVHVWELGAVQVLTTTRQIQILCRLVHRHHELQKEPELTFRERIWSNLPWANPGRAR